MKNANKILVGNPEGERPLERPRRRWKNNSKVELGDEWYEVMDCVRLAQDR
jgi:hypothetical protein